MKTRASRRTATNANRTRGAMIPVGGILLTATQSLPEGTFLCDGTAVSRTDYPALFEAIGTAFGDGDGATTFNLPTLHAPASGLRYVVRFANTLAQLEDAEDW